MLCIECNRLNDAAHTKKRHALGFDRAAMPGGGMGYRKYISPVESIGKPDDRERRASCLGGQCRDHIVHIGGWPPAEGCLIIGLEVAENLQPLTRSANGLKWNRPPEPDGDMAVGIDVERRLTIEEQRWFVQRRMAIWAQDIVWVDGKLERIRWELYRFGDKGLVEYLGVEPEAAE